MILQALYDYYERRMCRNYGEGTWIFCFLEEMMCRIYEKYQSSLVEARDESQFMIAWASASFAISIMTILFFSTIILT